MRILKVAVALIISIVSAADVKSLEGNMNYIAQENKINSALKKDSDNDNHLA